ncbi:MAG: hypothetical protein WBD02_09235 [Acidimicrobiia bacterium]
MFKRVTWAGAGFAAGIGSSVWAARKVKAVARKAAPRAVLDRTQLRIDRTRTNMRDAITEGRTAADIRARELRAQIDRTPRNHVQ